MTENICCGDFDSGRPCEGCPGPSKPTTTPPASFGTVRLPGSFTPDLAQDYLR